LSSHHVLTDSHAPAAGAVPTGDIDRFGFESYLDMPMDRPDAPRADMHSAMENKLGRAWADSARHGIGHLDSITEDSKCVW
jgi:hypothetical protein